MLFPCSRSLPLLSSTAPKNASVSCSVQNRGLLRCAVRAICSCNTMGIHIPFMRSRHHCSSVKATPARSNTAVLTRRLLHCSSRNLRDYYRRSIPNLEPMVSDTLASLLKNMYGSMFDPMFFCLWCPRIDSLVDHALLETTYEHTGRW